MVELMGADWDFSSPPGSPALSLPPSIREVLDSVRAEFGMDGSVPNSRDELSTISLLERPQEAPIVCSKKEVGMKVDQSTLEMPHQEEMEESLLDDQANGLEKNAYQQNGASNQQRAASKLNKLDEDVEQQHDVENRIPSQHPSLRIAPKQPEEQGIPTIDDHQEGLPCHKDEELQREGKMLKQSHEIMVLNNSSTINKPERFQPIVIKRPLAKVKAAANKPTSDNQTSFLTSLPVTRTYHGRSPEVLKMNSTCDQKKMINIGVKPSITKNALGINENENRIKVILPKTRKVAETLGFTNNGKNRKCDSVVDENSLESEDSSRSFALQKNAGEKTNRLLEEKKKLGGNFTNESRIPQTLNDSSVTMDPESGEIHPVKRKCSKFIPGSESNTELEVGDYTVMSAAESKKIKVENFSDDERQRANGNKEEIIDEEDLRRKRSKFILGSDSNTELEVNGLSASESKKIKVENFSDDERPPGDAIEEERLDEESKINPVAVWKAELLSSDFNLMYCSLRAILMETISTNERSRLIQTMIATISEIKGVIMHNQNPTQQSVLCETPAQNDLEHDVGNAVGRGKRGVKGLRAKEYILNKKRVKLLMKKNPNGTTTCLICGMVRGANQSANAPCKACSAFSYRIERAYTLGSPLPTCQHAEYSGGAKCKSCRYRQFRFLGMTATDTRVRKVKSRFCLVCERTSHAFRNAWQCSKCYYFFLKLARTKSTMPQCAHRGEFPQACEGCRCYKLQVEWHKNDKRPYPLPIVKKKIFNVHLEVLRRVL